MLRPLRLGSGFGKLALWVASAGLALLATGCSITRGAKLRPVEGAKATATVGEQVLPPIVGTPGNQQVVAVEPPSEPYRNAKARISGRVVDEQGRGVSGATVRLADGSSRAGKEVATTTDDSGGFTLSGLRPGSGYYLVAEANFADARGLMVGRTRADTSARRVRIQLGRNTDSRDPDSTDEAVASGSPVRNPRGRTASDRSGDPDDHNPSDDRAKSPRSGPATPHRPTPDDEVEQASGWRTPGSAEAPARSRPTSVPPPLEEVNDPADRLDLDPGPTSPAARSSHPRPSADEANPLPMSVHPPGFDRSTDASGTDEAESEPLRPIDQSSPDRPRAATEDRPLAQESSPTPPEDWVVGGPAQLPAGSTASEPPPLPDITQALPLDATPTPDSPASVGREPVIAATTPEPSPAMSLEGPAGAGGTESALPAVPIASAATPAPTVSPDPGDSSTYDPFQLMKIPPRKPGEEQPGPVNPQPTVASLPAPAGGAAATVAPTLASGSVPAPPDSAEAPPKPMTWGELAQSPGAGPRVEGATASSSPPASAARGLPVSSRSGGFFLSRRSRGAAATPTFQPSCDFDAKGKRLVDFQLPALDGSPARFRDFDADLVLLDFWGTWCPPCIQSIPHLIELQKRYEPSQLRVVGIACEDAPPTRRAAQVNKTTQSLGINYSVLVTGHDGTCPVQNALKIQHYPTMVLLDRSGRVVWRGVGSTPENLAKLDQAITEARGGGSSAGRLARR